MGLIHVTTTLRAREKARKKYAADFLVDTGATETLAPAKELKKAGIKPRGRMAYELADGRTVEYDFGWWRSNLVISSCELTSALLGLVRFN